MDRHCAARVKLPPFNIDAPAAIAFSGGGDSTALLHTCRDNPAITHAFIIDHALRDGSADEVAAAAHYARSLGYHVQTERWTHNGITAGVQVKAREYRYAAMGQMCRSAGIGHLITAHTEDDQAETILMRLDRQTGWRGLAGMQPSAYGPLWPALAGVTLHRPWLGVSRTEIRKYLLQHELSYVDDPSNESTDFTRIRARQALSADPNLRSDLIGQQSHAQERLLAERGAHAQWLSRNVVLHKDGFIETDAVPPPELLLHILNAVSGQGGPIDAAKRARLCQEMAKPDFNAATLSGAWVRRKMRESGHTYVFLRDRVAVTGRRGIIQVPALTLEKGALTVWDGRFSIRSKTDNLRVEAALGHLQNLRQVAEFKSLFDLPVEARATLPIFFRGDDPVSYGACATKYVTSEAYSAKRLQALYSNQDFVPF